MMPHGVGLPKEKKPGLAEKAYLLRIAGESYEGVAFELDVSTPTARNLILLGQRNGVNGEFASFVKAIQNMERDLAEARAGLRELLGVED